ncbi:MAG TPA: tetratricopeptide repeat protein, partial [Pyrinomonadaceae bacterium]|nr:tetratricopeptide repeat protein [Pyrinomonadaceae bacterium]
YQTEREMGRLPPLPTMANGLNEGRLAWDDYNNEDGEYYWEKAEKKAKDLDTLWARAETAEQDGDLALDRKLLEEYLQLTDVVRSPESSEIKSQGRRNSASDRLDALSALDSGSNSLAVKAYLEARRLHDGANPDSSAIDRLLEPIQSDRNLKDNVVYLKAAEKYQQKQYQEAAEAFKALAQQYPRSEKREAALFMTAVATMKSSATYIPFSGNADYDSKEPAASADQAWHDAYTAFQQLVNEYPRGKYFNEARGWQAYLHLRRHDRAAALVQYYRMLTDDDEKARTEAAFSLTLVRSAATDEEISRVEKELAGDPRAALAYAYHNIYNYAIDPTSESAPYEVVKDSSGQEDFEATRRRSEELEKEWRADKKRLGQEGLTRTLEFAKRLMTAFPNLSVGGAFALRAAQASAELDDNEGAVKFAQRALQSRLADAERCQALWTLGVAQQRLRRLDEARRNFQTLLHDYPKTNLVEGARRELAMIAEDSGDINAALEQYVALNYGIDEAYFIDVLMTPEQLANFIQTHPDLPRKNEFTYALGIRYLRRGRWQEARDAFAQVQVKGAFNSSVYSMGNNCYDKPKQNCLDPKDGEKDQDGKRIITPRLLMRDIQTANDLEALERVANQARDAETSAEALYQFASYQFEASTLLFYNPIAWQPSYALNTRYWDLSELAASGRYRVTNEAQLLFEHMQEHDTPARALKIFLQVVDRFPQTRAARDALYSAAVCHDRLSNYNAYWRDIYENRMHAGERMVTYADVKAAYPRYQLPQGTYGWQPSTRTVNNGPGWAPPPPPPPRPKRLTRTERVKLYAGLVRDQVTNFWHDHGKRWLIEIVIVLSLIFMVRLARRNQRRLRARLARQRLAQAKQVVRYPWFDWFWIEPVVPSRREQIRKFLGDKRQEFLDLLLDRRSRPVLVRSIVSHSAVTGLVISLVWTIWFS